MDFKTVARVSATLKCPGVCAIDKRFLNDVEEIRLATLTCIAEFSVHGEPLDSMDMHMLLAQHGALVFPYCNLAMYHAQTQIMTGMWYLYNIRMYFYVACFGIACLTFPITG